MGNCEEMRCCGRAMTSIGVEQAAGELRLHSCPACGRHAWRDRDRVLDRAEVLASLRPKKERAAPRRVELDRPAPAAAPPAPVDRRDELRTMLSGFTVHGNTS